ncbi:hypothetical protein GQ53DRAFT_790123 [Thozetella sp. PMI_491]|nr:hypothetical protein GQ53DRAFT_790123 [Thozetella sp. PMI_491]
MASEIKTVGVVSTGVIGSSFIALCLARGLKVLAASPSVGAADRLAAYLEKIWPTLDTQLGLSPGASIENYKFVGNSLAGYYDEIDFVQENAPERLELKQNIIAELDAGLRPEVVIASSSSGIPSSKFITGAKRHPERVLIGHPFNPPHLIPLIEVVPHQDTSTEASSLALDFYKSLGQKPILLKHELPGFIANRLQAAVVVEAYSLVARGIVSAEDADLCMTESLGPRWAFTGPFATLSLASRGGKDGFTRTMKHMGPGAQVWMEDMRKHTVAINDESIEKVNASVQDMLATYDLEAFEKRRNEALVELFKAKMDVKPTGNAP